VSDQRIDFLITAYLYGNLSDDRLPEIKLSLIRSFQENRVLARNRLKCVFGSGGSIGYRIDPNSKVKENVLRMVLSIGDRILERQIAKLIFTKKDFSFISLYLEIKTGIPVDISNPETIKQNHISIIKENIKLFGLTDIYYGLSSLGTLRHLCYIDSSIAKTAEAHILQKSILYKKFYNLPKFVAAYPACNKKKIYLAVLKFSHYSSANYALRKLSADPDLKNLSVLL
jgi:hypothetical protein